MYYKPLTMMPQDASSSRPCSLYNNSQSYLTSPGRCIFETLMEKAHAGINDLLKLTDTRLW